MKIHKFNLGATGRFPQGQVDAHDEGALRMVIVADLQHAIVRVIFGKQIEWIGLPATEARQLAAMLIEEADKLDRRKT